MQPSQTVTIKLSGLTCEACIKLASKRLKNIDGIEDVQIKDIGGETKITTTRPVTADEIRAALSDSDYKVV